MTKTCQLRGKWHDKLKFIGQYQPIRLVNNFENFIQTNNWKKEFDSISLLEINHIEYIGEGDVAAIATSTKTYFADGFGAHNSVAQHSLLVSYLCDQDFALQGLLHDSSEGLGLTDINAPLKRTPIFAAYREAEKKLQSMIFRKFGCPEEDHVSVKAADQRLLVNEAREFLSPIHPEWKNKFEPFPFRIEAMSQEEAKKQFLKRFWELRENDLIV
jgi:5'-deoxynucleotidase YfbR-like HD superfamily hydrolase